MVADAALFLFQVYFCDKSLFFTSIARENEAHCKKDSDLVIHTYIYTFAGITDGLKHCCIHTEKNIKLRLKVNFQIRDIFINKFEIKEKVELSLYYMFLPFGTHYFQCNNYKLLNTKRTLLGDTT